MVSSIAAALSYFSTTKYPYGLPDHLFHFFTIYFAITAVSIWLVVINCYRTLASPKFWHLFFIFWKMWS